MVDIYIANQLAEFKEKAMSKTRGEIEAAFTKAIIKLEKEYLGRGPLDARTFLVDDMILVRLRGVLTQAEQKLAETPQGSHLIKETRQQLFETSKELLRSIVEEIISCKVLSFHSDISTKNAERIIVLTVDRNLEKEFRS
jgi:uncharacterized protein YbcI